MAEAIPFLSAGVGFLVGGPGGAQVGWMVGAGIYSAVSPSPRIAAGDPSSAPNVGSDIRGQTIPVVFGTVRAAGYLTWQKNFLPKKQTRKVGSGKKKTKQEYYSYFWDFIYHMGMVTREYTIIGMWEGSERVQDLSLNAITFASGQTFAPAVKEDQQQSIAGILNTSLFGSLASFQRFSESTQAAKTLTWGEAYFYGGHGASDPEDGWAWFQSQEASPDIRWPHTVWIGFKQLGLGEQPRIPQLNFEITPVADGEMSGNFIGTNHATASGTDDNIPTGSTLAGFFHLFSSVAAAEMVRIVDRQGRIVTTLQEADFQTLFPALNSLEVVDTNFIGAYMLPGTDDFIAFFAGQDAVLPANNNFVMALNCTINSNGSVSAVGYSKMPRVLDGWWQAVYAVGLDDSFQYIVAVGERTSNDAVEIGRFPYPRTQGSTLDGGDFEAGNGNCTGLGVGNGLMDPAETYQPIAANHAFAGWVQPLDTLDVRYYFYVSAARIRWSDDNPTLDNSYIEANKATYPNGWLAYVQLDVTTMTVGSPTVANADFNIAGPPFDDENENADGSSAGAWTSPFDAVGYSERFYPQPAVMGLANTGWVVLFEKQMSTATNTTVGAHHTVRGFLFNGSSFIYIGDLDQELEDVCLEYDLPDADRFDTLADANTLLHYAPFGGAVYRVGTRQGGGNWRGYVSNVGKFQYGTIDLTPPEIVREIFTNDVLGQAQPASRINTDTYDEAHNFCLQNNILISAVFAASQSRTQVFESLVNVYGGWVAWTGTELVFGRPQEDLTPVVEIGNEHFIQPDPQKARPPFNAKRQALQETANRVTIKYFDRSLSYRVNEVTLNDEVDQDLNGVRRKEINTGFVMSKDTAYRMAERILWSNLYARTIYSDILVGWSRARVQPGDVVLLRESLSNTNVICRVTKREIVARGQYKLTLIEELDYLGKSKPLVEAPRPPLRGIPTTTDLPLDFQLYELPREFTPAGPAYFVGWAPGGPSAGALLYTSASTVGFRLAGSILPFPDNGRILTALPPTDDVVFNAQVVLNVRSWANVNSSPVWFPGELEDFGAVDRSLGLSVLRVGSEMMAYEGATLVASNVYQLDRLYRGWGGTQAESHGPGDVFWLHGAAEDGSGIFVFPYAADQIGTQIFYKVAPVGFDNVEYDATSVPYKSHVLQGTFYAPRALAASKLRVLAGSGGGTLPSSLPTFYNLPWGDTSLDLIPHQYQRLVGSGPERNMTFVWPEVSQDTGYGAKGYGVAGYGEFEADDDTVSYTVNVVGSGNVVVRSTVVTTPVFQYPALTNASDNGAWRGSVAVTVRPKNIYGSAPFAAVASLNFVG